MKTLMLLWTILFMTTGFSFVDGITNVGVGCSQNPNSTVNTIYEANLRTLLNSLVKDAPLQGGFLNTSFGNGSDQVYGLAWCRVDASPNTCYTCLNDSVTIPLRDCPESKDLEIWSSMCSLRFSNENFFGNLWNRSSSSSYNGNKLDDDSVFSRGFAMMEALGRNVSNNSLMFGTSVIGVGNDGERYGLGQCSRDLSNSDCEKCFANLLTTYRSYVLNRTGWEMLGVSCGMWYDNYRFYDNVSRPNNPTPNASGSGERWHKGDVKVMLAFVAILLFRWIS